MKNFNKTKLLVIALSVILGVSTLASLIVTSGMLDDDKKSSSSQITGSANYVVQDNRSIYSEESDEVNNMYITVVKDNKDTLSNLLNYTYRNYMAQEDKTVGKPAVDIQVDFNTPTVFSASTSNASMEPKGHASSSAAQKSFKITLADKTDKWNGQKVINLSKSPYDITRIRNKLAFDLFESIPNMFSMRTEFVHLYVKDLTGASNEFVDYGLYTQIEQPNEAYIKNHGLAQEGYLYKAQYFEFLRYPDKIKNVDDPTFDEAAFNTILKTRGINDNTRLIKMLDDVNNYDININDVIDKHFNRENYLTWLASNILTGNFDTNSQNFLLFSPLTSEQWYFLPWDFDGSLGFSTQAGSSSKYSSWQSEALSNYWGVTLHRRFFSDPNNLNELKTKVEEVSYYMSSEKIEALVSKYYGITNSLIKTAPDLQFLPSTADDYETEIKRLPTVVEENKKNFFTSIDIPMPVFLGDPVAIGAQYEFVWNESFDFNGSDLTYKYTIATDPAFTNVVSMTDSIKTPSIRVDNLTAGTYYWKVDIYNAKGNHQIAFDSYRDLASKTVYYGVKKLEIK
jgi:spore coat protein H